MRNRIYIGVVLTGVIFLGLFYLPGCKKYHRNRSHVKVAGSSIRRGEVLAQVYCQSCHKLPDPALLDAHSWEKGVLPEMGPRLGIFDYNFEIYPSGRRDSSLRGYYPARPLVTPEEWQHILDYYTATSPDSLGPQMRPRPIKNGVSLFKVEIPSIRYDAPSTTLVRVDTSGERGLLLFDANYENLYRFDTGLVLRDSLHTKGAIVDLEWQGEGMVACNIGQMTPTNRKLGKVQRLYTGPAGRLQLDTLPLFDQLARPVQLTSADLNQDGKTDYVVCEFGNQIGALSWMENKGGHRFERHVMRPVAGAIKAIVDDYNHDGKPDCWVLFAQGEEGLFRFTNEGGGKFSEEELLRFPPMYGSSYFELDDFNKDGHPDILYTCGDNADFSPVLKPYHGVYIYMNDGHDHFSQQYFFPINGCYKAVARDFDGDGDLDIATISFFPDLKHQPEEGFVYLENLGGFDFQPYSLPEGKLGKWLTMDVADLDGDGRADIVLGNFSFFTPVTAMGVDFKKGPPFIVLKNRGIVKVEQASK